MDFHFRKDKLDLVMKTKRLYTIYGKVSEVVGLIIKVDGLDAFVGEICEIYVKNLNTIAMSEVVGFVKNTVLLMPLGELAGIGPGCLVRATGQTLMVKISEEMLGSTLDGLGRPIDGKVFSKLKNIQYLKTRQIHFNVSQSQM